MTDINEDIFQEDLFNATQIQLQLLHDIARVNRPLQWLPD